MNIYPSIYLKKRKEESLRRLHPWVFSGAIHRLDNGIEEGTVVKVYSFEGEFLGVGHYQKGTIAVRILSFQDVTIDRSFWLSRLTAALQMRQQTGIISKTDNNTYRLVHGEGDNLSGLVIDIYGKTAVIQAHSVGMHHAREQICGALLDIMTDRLAAVYYKSDTTLPFKEGLHADNGFLFGNESDNIALENGLRFHIDWLKGQKTGFFIDQRENRLLLERYASNRSVLNMFCYTGGFSVYALRGGAKVVHSVDSSAKAIDLTDKNVRMNFPDDDRHTSYCEDAFKFLEANNNQYDLIILDPPAFAKHRSALHNALKGYIRLNAKGLEAIKHGGILFTFSCSQAISKEHFQQAVFSAALQAGRNVQILHQLHQPADHPISICHPEGEYLKGLVLYVE